MQELGIQPPDPVLLLATLDRFAAGLGKHSPQVAFRLQVTRAALRVDTAPTEQGIHQFSESLLAEGEAVFHGGSWLPLKESVKVRALDGDAQVHKDDHHARPCSHQFSLKFSTTILYGSTTLFQEASL